MKYINKLLCKYTGHVLDIRLIECLFIQETYCKRCGKKIK